MRDGFRQIGTLLVILLLLNSLALAQDQPPSIQTPANQSTELQEFNAALAQDDANARAAALRRFLASWPKSEQAGQAREMLVQSIAATAEPMLAAQRIEQALATFRQALAEAPEQLSNKLFDETLIRIPLAVAVRGYRTEAIVIAREIEARCQGDASRLGALGEFYLSLEAVSDAIRALEHAAGLAPGEARVQRTLGGAYRMALRLPEAMAAYQRAIGANPEDQRAYYELGNLNRAQGSYEEALKLYRKQLEIDPTNTASIKGVALTLLAQGKDEAAKTELDRIRALKGNDDEITRDYYFQTQLAFYYLLHNQLDQARKAADQALMAEPRFSWGRIAAAEVALTENKYFEAERHLLAAKQYSNFPTLEFLLGRLYLTVEDFDDSLTQFSKAFSYSPADGYKTMLGGVREVKTDRLADLLAPEQQAAIFLFEPLTTYPQYRLAETLIHLDAVFRSEPQATAQQTEKQTEPDPARTGSGNEVMAASSELERAAGEFVEAEPTRAPFRAIYLARKLAVAGKALDLAVKLADQAQENAEAATKPDGALRDYPNYDREGRLRIFRGRAADAKGWALLKAGRIAEAMTALNLAVDAYGDLPEGRQARWHLASVHESAGDLPEALELYLAAYERPVGSGEQDLNRSIIEALYRKIHGSLDGLDERLARPDTLASARQTRSASVPAVEGHNRAVPAKEPVSDPIKSVIRNSPPAGRETEIVRIEKGASPTPAIPPPVAINLLKGRAATAEPETGKPAATAAKAEGESVVPVVLPEIRVTNNLNVATGPLSPATLVILNPDHGPVTEADSAPPPVITASTATRPRHVTTTPALVSSRPRQVSGTRPVTDQTEVPARTRKRRVTVSAEPRPEGQ